MKSRTVIILWSVAIVLGIIAYFVKFHGKEENLTQTQRAPGDRLLESLPIREITSVTIEQGDVTTHLVRAEDNSWGVKERANYPINYELLRNLLGSLNELEVTQGYPAAKEYWARFGLADENAPEDIERGYLGATKVTMMGTGDEPLAQVYLGKYSGSSQVGGRFVRVAGDDSGVYAVGQTFPGITAEPKDWLGKDFLKVDQMQTITLSAPEDPEFTTWKLTRPNAQAQFSLAGMSEDEVMQLTSTNALRALFQYSGFQDVLSPERSQELANPDAKLKRRAVITTFDGLTYTLDFWPEQAPAKDKDSDPRLPALQPKYHFTIAVKADIPKERAKSADEKPEDSQRLDAQFAQTQQAAQEKLAAARALEGRIFQVSQSLVSPLLKQRSDFVTAKTKPSAASPPVRVPAAQP